MINLIAAVIVNVLKALYQPFWFALLLSICFMFVYLFAKESGSGQGWRKSVSIWWEQLRGNAKFRKLFFLTFYTTMILFRTLINRDMWMNPVSNVIGRWWLYAVDKTTGEIAITTEFIENVIMFIPFSVLLMWYIEQKKEIRYVLWTSIKVVFLFSVSIEFLQLFLRLGTFQLSDMFYNTVGGFIGGLIYWIFYKLNKRLS